MKILATLSLIFLSVSIGTSNKIKNDLRHNLMKADKSYTYIDGSNNKYIILAQKNDATIEYVPIKPAESSSGTYSGGEPYKITISLADHKSLTELLNKSCKDDSQLSMERNMGCGTIILPRNKVYFLKMDSFNKSAIETKLKKLKTDSQPKEEKVNRDTTVVLGKIIEKSFESKKGVMTDIKEFYFVPTQVKDSNYKDEYFVKLSKGNIKREELKKYVNKEINVKVIMLRGLWDADDNTHQSRFGDYVIILEIIK